MNGTDEHTFRIGFIYVPLNQILWHHVLFHLVFYLSYSWIYNILAYKLCCSITKINLKRAVRMIEENYTHIPSIVFIHISFPPQLYGDVGPIRSAVQSSHNIPAAVV